MQVGGFLRFFFPLKRLFGSICALHVRVLGNSKGLPILVCLAFMRDKSELLSGKL